LEFLIHHLLDFLEEDLLEVYFLFLLLLELVRVLYLHQPLLLNLLLNHYLLFFHHLLHL
jgi:hypothetical protein